jgi:hypothetical protein
MLGGGNSGAWHTPGRVSVVPDGHSCPRREPDRFPPRCAPIPTPSAAMAMARPPIEMTIHVKPRPSNYRDRYFAGIGLSGRLCVPEDRHDPPARPIAVQLKAVDAAREWLAVRSALRVVRTEGVQHGAECLGGAVNLAFEETLPLQARASCGNVLLGGSTPRVSSCPACVAPTGSGARRGSAASGIEPSRAADPPARKSMRRPRR